MRGACALAGIRDRRRAVREVVHRHRGQAHQASVTRRARVRAPGKGLVVVQEALQGIADSHPDVEAFAGAAQISFFHPATITPHLVGRVEAAGIEQAGGQIQGHRGVVGPLAGLQRKWSAADHVGERGEAAAAPELHRRADGIPARQPEQGAAKTLARLYSGSLAARTHRLAHQHEQARFERGHIDVEAKLFLQ